MNHLNSLWNVIATGSLRAGVLILIVFALRWLLRGRVPAQCFHWLWVLVAIRLLLPAVPGSATSVFNLLSPTRGENLAESPQWVVRKEAVLRPESFQLGEKTVPSVAVEAPPAASRSTWGVSLFPLFWLAGIILQIVLLTRSALQMRRSIRRATPITNPGVLSIARECADIVKLPSTVEIFSSAEAGGPAIVGLWRPRLILPVGLTDRLTVQELRFILLHEYAHLRRRDLLVMWLLTATRVVHWFNPLTWLAVRAARVDTELACDETLLRHTSADASVPYGETLLKLTQLSHGDSRPSLWWH